MNHRLVKAPRGRHIGKRLDKPAASEADLAYPARTPTIAVLMRHAGTAPRCSVQR